MDFITALFGRLHPLVVHLPIGILFMAFLFECLSASKKFRPLRKAVQPALFWGVVFAIAASISGYFLRQEGGYEERLANLHQNFGIGTACLALVVFVLRRRTKFWVNDPIKRKQLRILLSIPLILLLSITGHWGGSLTHGEDYLFAVVSGTGEDAEDPAIRIREIANIPQAVFYDDVIQPILEARCYDCHSSSKQKGELRLDMEAYITRGGEHGKIISDGPADSSSLYKRLVLPIEDEEHMPPGEKPQLSSSEIALIKYWVEEGAEFDKSIAASKNNDKITAIVQSFQEVPRESWIPTEPVKLADGNALEKLQALGITPMPLASGDNHFMVTFTGTQHITDEQISSLQIITDQLVWLNLSHTRITDQQLGAVSKLSNLRVLYLNNTGITDAGLAKLSSLTKLRWLSLVGTRVTDESVATFVKLEKLTDLFLFQTALTDGGFQQLKEKRGDVSVDTGNYMLKPLPTDTVVYKKISSAK